MTSLGIGQLAKRAGVAIDTVRYYERNHLLSPSTLRNAPMIWYDSRFDSSPFWEGVNVNLDMVDHVWGRIFRDIDITVGLEPVTQPVFLALGRYDFLLAPPSIWDPLRGRFQDLTIHIFEMSGHWPQYEEAELFDRRLLEWMNGGGTTG